MGSRCSEFTSCSARLSPPALHYRWVRQTLMGNSLQSIRIACLTHALATRCATSRKTKTISSKLNHFGVSVKISQCRFWNDFRFSVKIKNLFLIFSQQFHQKAFWTWLASALQKMLLHSGSAKNNFGASPGVVRNVQGLPLPVKKICSRRFDPKVTKNCLDCLVGQKRTGIGVVFN